MIESPLHKLYDASISIGTDGGMLVSSTQDRVMAWGLLFCVIGASSLIIYLFRQGRFSGKVALIVFGVSLLVAVFVMPSVKHEYIHVTTSRIIVDTGAWYGSSRTVFHINRLDQISERRDSTIPSNLMGDPDVSWHVRRHDGEMEVLELNDFFNAHRMVVAYYYKDRGYRLQRLEERDVADGRR